MYDREQKPEKVEDRSRTDAQDVDDRFAAQDVANQARMHRPTQHRGLDGAMRGPVEAGGAEPEHMVSARQFGEPAPRTMSAYEYATGKKLPPGEAAGLGSQPMGAYEYATGRKPPREAEGPSPRGSDDLAMGPGVAPPAAAATKQASVAVTTDRPRLEFTSVVGRPTLPEPITIKNHSGKVLGLDARIEPAEASAAFRIWQGDGVFAPPIESNRPQAVVSVRFLAPKAGSQSATLVVHHDLGELRVPIVATAMDIGKHARTEAVAGGPEPVHDLPAHPAPIRTREQAHSQLLDAADALSSVATTFDQTVPEADAAAHAFGERIIAASARLERQILEWAIAEGRHQMQKASVKGESLSGAAFLKWLAKQGFDKGVDAISEEQPEIKFAVAALEWAFDNIGQTATAPNQEDGKREQSYDRHMQGVAFFGNRATDAVATTLAHGFAKEMNDYREARSALARAAAPAGEGSSGRALADIHTALGKLDHGVFDRDSIERALAEARKAMKTFRDGVFDTTTYPRKAEPGAWSMALAHLAEAGVKADRVADAAYGALLDRYLQFKAGGGAGSIETRGGEVRASGTINLTAGDIQLTGFTFGKLTDPSPMVYEHIQTKSLADLVGWDVHIELHGVYGGTLTLHQGPAGPSKRDAKVSSDMTSQLASIGGIDRLWQLLDGATLGTSTIWVRE